MANMITTRPRSPPASPPIIPPTLVPESGWSEVVALAAEDAAERVV